MSDDERYEAAAPTREERASVIRVPFQIGESAVQVRHYCEMRDLDVVRARRIHLRINRKPARCYS